MISMMPVTLVHSTVYSQPMPMPECPKMQYCPEPMHMPSYGGGGGGYGGGMDMGGGGGGGYGGGQMEMTGGYRRRR